MGLPKAWDHKQYSTNIQKGILYVKIEIYYPLLGDSFPELDVKIFHGPLKIPVDLKRSRI